MLNRLFRVLGLVFILAAVIALMATALPVHTSQAASLVQITNFGADPTNNLMYLYVPTSVQAKPPILVALHQCTGTGPGFYSSTEFASFADKYGFIVIYPDANRSGQCWDVSSPGALTHTGNSDPVGITSMVTYVEQHNNGDPNRVYVTGASSGAMMTNVLLGDYPDVFKAGAAFMGVPFACFATTDGSSWNSACANGQITKTPQQWGDLVRGAYPTYTGSRPRMQVWHGTADTTLNYNNFGEEIKQWTNVLGVSQTPSFTDSPVSGWTRTRYGSTGIGGPVEGISIANVGHVLPQTGMAVYAIQFLGLDNTSSTPMPTATTGPSATPSKTSTPAPSSTTGPTPTTGPTNTPVAGANGLNVLIDKGGGTDNTQETTFNFLVKNTGTSAISSISTRVYFTTDGSNAGSAYALDKYYDQSGVATISGPTLACGSTYYFTVSYGTVSLAAGGQWEYQTALHLSSWGSTYSGSNDWYHTGYAVGALPASYTNTNYIPGYVNGTLSWGSTPSCGGATNTPAATVVPTNTFAPPPSSTPLPTTASTNVPTNTSVPTTGPSATPIPPTKTNTPAPTTSGNCTPNATITAPFTFDGAGTLCWKSNSLGSYINSWNLASLTINGVTITNVYVASGSYPAKASDGYWYISYSSSVAYGHFETK